MFIISLNLKTRLGTDLRLVRWQRLQWWARYWTDGNGQLHINFSWSSTCHNL